MKKLLIVAVTYGAVKTWTSRRTRLTFNDFVKENNLESQYNVWYKGYVARKSEEFDIRYSRW